MKHGGPVRRLAGPGAVLLLLVVALGAVGVGYALWSKTISISATTQTGRLHARWTAASSSDRAGALDQNLDRDGNVIDVDKDVGRLDCFVDRADRQILHFNVVNGYPSYFADCEGEWRNDGTIPVKVVSLRIDTDCGPPIPIDFDRWVDLDLDCDGRFDVNFQVTNDLCHQVDPEEVEANSIKVHVKQDAPQGRTLGWTAEIQLNQWNESSPPCQPVIRG